MSSVIIKILGFFTLALPLWNCTQADHSEKPNVVIIFIDDMGYADPSCFGNPLVETPNIDALAESGLRFTNFYVNSPICSPSRVALNTGCYPMRFSIHAHIASAKQNRDRAMADFLDPSVPTMARTLQQHGYATGHFGKWHMGGGRDLGEVPHPSAYGFEQSLVSFEGIGDRVLFPGHGLSRQSEELGKGQIIKEEKHRSTEIYLDSALSFMRRTKDQPFFVNLCPNDVHDRHLPAPGAAEAFAGITENPHEQKFLAVLSELDRQIGRFIDELEAMGKGDNTIIVFTSDNGPTDWPWYYEQRTYPEGYTGDLYPPGFTGDFYGRKWSLYEGGIRMPFIIRWPGHIPAGASDEKTTLVAMDLFPSICSLLDIPWPKTVDGTDRSPAFRGIPILEGPPIMWQYASNPGGSILPGNREFISPNLAMREGDWKLLINADSTDARLYNLARDPGETDNLAGSESNRVAEMAGRLIAWRRSMPVDIRRD